MAVSKQLGKIRIRFGSGSGRIQLIWIRFGSGSGRIQMIRIRHGSGSGRIAKFRIRCTPTYKTRNGADVHQNLPKNYLKLGINYGIGLELGLGIGLRRNFILRTCLCLTNFRFDFV